MCGRHASCLFGAISTTFSESSLKFNVDAEFIGWVDNPFFVFVWQLFEGYTTSFELPFLSLRGRLLVAKLLPKDVGDLTGEHLKKATRGLRQREPAH